MSAPVLWSIGHSQMLGFPASYPSPRPYIHERASGNTLTTTRVAMAGHLTEEFSGLKHSGVSGAKFSDINTNIATYWATASVGAPTDVLLFAGTNEVPVAAGVSAATMKANAQTLINTLVGYGLRVHLCLICPRADASSGLVAAYNVELAAVTGTTTMIDPGAASWWVNATCLQTDNLHLTPHADLQIARLWLAALRAAGVSV